MFFSLKTAYILLVLLAVLLGLGNYISTIPAEAQVFKEMNMGHFFSLLSSYVAHPRLLMWLIALIFTGALLFLNTVCCTYKQVIRYRQNTRPDTVGEKRNRGMMIIHIIAIVVIAFHAIDIALVKRHKPQQLFAKESAQLGGYTVTINSIDYVTDRSVITQSHKGERISATRITSNEFSILGNRAELSVFKDGVLVKKGLISMLHPLRYGGTYFILDGFVVPYGSDNNEVAALVHYTYNPLVIPFFAVYVLMLVCLILHLVKHRYRPEKRSSEQCRDSVHIKDCKRSK